MPKAIAGAAMMAGAVALEVATAGAATPLAAQMFLGGIAMEAGAIAHALGSNQGIGITTRQAAAFRQLIYGEYRIGASNTYRSTTGSKHDQFNFIDILAGHPCDSIPGAYLDGRQVYWQGSGTGYNVRNGVGFGGIADGADHVGPGGQHYNFGGTGHSGIYFEARYGDHSLASAGPNFPPGDPGIITGLTANDPNWAASGGETPLCLGCTLVYFKAEFNPNLFPSEPERRYTVRGKNNIFDPRTGTYGWTNNWALIVADMLTDTTFGLGDVGRVNQAQLVAAANVCDEMVSLANGNTEKRYTLNKAYDSSVSPGDMLDDAMKAAGGRLSYVGGEWFIFPRYWQGPSFSFSSSMLTGPVQWKPYRSLKDRCNRVRGTYMAPNVPYNDAGNLYDSNGWWNGTILNNWPFSWHPTNYPQYAQDPQHGYAADLFLEADSGVQGAWASGTTYAQDDVITYSGVIYKSLVDGNVGNQPDTSSWIAQGPAGAWASGTTYAQGDAAVYGTGMQLYVSLVSANTGNQPDTSPADWAPVVWVAYQNLLPQELDLDNVLSITQAQRLAKIALLVNRQEGRGTLPLHLACYQVQPLDVITFDFPEMGWSGKLLEVVATRFYVEPDPADEKAQRVRFEVQVQETDSSIYDWSTTEELTPYDVPANPTGLPWTIDAPTGLTLLSDATTAYVGTDGITHPRIKASWTAPTDVRVTQIQIQYAVHGTTNWIDAGTVDAGTTFALIDGVVNGTQYDVQIRSLANNGGTSSWVQAGPVTVSAPNSLTNSYSNAPQFALTNPTSTTIAVAAVAATFGNTTVNYAARTLTIPAPSPGTTVVYYVTIADPTQQGESGSPTLTATASTANTLCGVLGNTYIGAIYVTSAGGSTRVTPGGWPAPTGFQVI